MTSERFDLTTPDYDLRTRGCARRVAVPHWEGPAVAAAVDEALAAVEREGRGGPRPIVVGLIPFDHAQPALLYVPDEVEWQSPPPRAVDPGPDGAPLEVEGVDTPAYLAKVEAALGRIAAGPLEKVVLARHVTMRAPAPFDVDRIAARLRARNRDAYVYRVHLPEGGGPAGTPWAEGGVLLGATPELVLGCTGGRVRSNPLAGSLPRVAEKDADAARAQALLQSSKDRAEHHFVVHATAETFRRFADDVTVSAAPELVATPVVWHLGSHIAGTLRPGLSPLELAYALHPTPAVSGWPQDAARAAIAELEDFDRGYFGGLVGWMDRTGNGAFALTIRCGLLRGPRATLYAGAGIVDGSTPDQEHVETWTKLQTVIDAL